MVGITNFFMYSGCITALIAFFFPLITKYFVNNVIEKRHNCKLDVEQNNIRYVFFYWYLKYFNPAKTIALAYLLNSQKMIDRNKSLKEINYNLKTAPRKEIFICVTLYLISFYGVFCLFAFLFLFKGFGVSV